MAGTSNIAAANNEYALATRIGMGLLKLPAKRSGYDTGHLQVY